MSYAWDGALRVWDCETGTQLSCEDVYRRYGFIEHSCLARGSMWVSTGWLDAIVNVLEGTEVEAEGGFGPYRLSWSGDAALVTHLGKGEGGGPPSCTTRARDGSSGGYPCPS